MRNLTKFNWWQKWFMLCPDQL